MKFKITILLSNRGRRNFSYKQHYFLFERHKDISKTKNIIISSIGEENKYVINSRRFGNLLNRALQIMQNIKFERRKANKRIIRDEARAIHFLAIELLEKISDRDNPARTLIMTDKTKIYSKPSEQTKKFSILRLNQT